MNRKHHTSFHTRGFHITESRLWRHGLMAGLSYSVLIGSLWAAEGEPEPQEVTAELELEEIIVTGSHIRGVGLSVGSKVEIIDRLEIDRSGFATTQQILQSLPMNFGGGESEDTRLNNSSFTAGTGVNLRGLGTSSTLLLVNGRRVPVAGFGANFLTYPQFQRRPLNALKYYRTAHRQSMADAIAGWPISSCAMIMTARKPGCDLAR